MAGYDEDKARWNRRYREDPHLDRKVDDWLLEKVSSLAPGSALDLAGGAGRHSLWLLQHGWDVTLADLSEAGLNLARARAHAEEESSASRLEIRCEPAADTVAWALHHSRRFHLVCVFWFLERALLPQLPGLLAPNGILLYKTFTAEHPRFADRHVPDWALRPGELAASFPQLVTIASQEQDGVASFVGRQPSIV